MSVSIPESKETAEYQYQMGVCYENGPDDDFPCDWEKAAEWYRKAADRGYAHAQCSLGSYYLSGSGGLPKDLNEGTKLLSEAAKQGHAGAQRILSKLVEQGLCVITSIQPKNI